MQNDKGRKILSNIFLLSECGSNMNETKILINIIVISTSTVSVINHAGGWSL